MIKKALLLTIVVSSTATCLAQRAQINLTCFPAISVADGHSTVTVTAEVRDLGGSFVRDATPVVFETDKGLFRGANVVQTNNGFARVVLVAPGLPGTAKVRASVFSLNASASLDIDFVNDRSILDTTKEVLEVTGRDGISYSQADKVVTASGKNRSAVLRYRDIEIKAEELQLRIPSYEVRARGADLTVGKSTESFRELYFKLNSRKGTAIKTLPKTELVFTPFPFGVLMSVQVSADTKVYDLTGFGSEERTGPVKLDVLAFINTSKAISTVEAKKVVVSPGRNIQFQKASVRLGGQSVMSLPLLQLDVNSSNPIVTEQFLNVSNSSVAVNYPYYLSLKPGETSALRFRYGNRYGNSLGATGGTYLDYEYNWNRGAKMEGGAALTGLNRKDWGVGLRQYWVPNSRTSLSAQVDLPAHRSLFADLNVNYRFNGVQTSVNSQHGKSLSGDRFTSSSLGINVDTDPRSIGKLPFTYSAGLTAQSRQISGLGQNSQQGAGLQGRINSRTLMISPRESVSLSYVATKWAGGQGNAPFSQGASLNLASNLVPGLFLNTTYQFNQDGFTEDVLGRHQLTLDGVYSAGRLNLRSYISKSLDLDRLTTTLGLDYRLNNTWRLSTGYTLDKYLSDTFAEQTFILGYRLGFRELGLSFSTRTRRLGIEVLGTRFN
ncbi:MAG: hypothetical protein JNM34_03565 [Chthonomonadaceae bacterium]|nr:hypothetical protein [Chthonomonadaceae bacterium]